MYKGIYIAASGAVLKQTQLEVITQNLANANTVGYKKDGIAFKDYLLPQEAAGNRPDGRVMSELSAFKTNFTNGTTMKTGNPLDMAIEGPGLFALENGAYTRRGEFRKDKDGYLTTQDGMKVMGNNGPIRIPEGTIDIDDAGNISVISEGKVSEDPIEVDAIKIMDFSQNGTMEKSGDGLFTVTGNGTKVTSGVRSGYIEMSNVDAVKEMVRMIEAMREFETYQKAIRTFDEATGKVTNELGRL